MSPLSLDVSICKVRLVISISQGVVGNIKLDTCSSINKAKSKTDPRDDWLAALQESLQSTSTLMFHYLILSFVGSEFGLLVHADRAPEGEGLFCII